MATVNYKVTKHSSKYLRSLLNSLKGTYTGLEQLKGDF